MTAIQRQDIKKELREELTKMYT